jgi:two-component system, cell cycle response regulator
MAGPVIPVEPETSLRTTHTNHSEDEPTSVVARQEFATTSEPPSVGAPIEAASLSSSSDRLRAVYLLANEFADEESLTAITSPPGSHADAGSPALHTEPVDRPVLLRMDGVQAGEVVSLAILPCFIGRHPGCQVIIDDAGVSRRHARIVLQQEEFWLEDLGSRNGTFIDGRRLDRKRLHDGVLIQVGLHASFRFTLVSARQEKLLRELYESSTRDALTGLYNRRHFDDRIRAEFAYAKRHQLDIGFVMVDVDFFKRVNDTYGHAAGDTVLKHIAKCLAKQLRTEDVIARIGGEEFAILLRGIGTEGARRLGERLRTNIEKLPIVAEGIPIAVTISAGCAALSETNDGTPKDLFDAADRRLYEAKRTGRNRVVAA